jgi:DNA-binding PadR family transcriptional regulator
LTRPKANLLQGTLDMLILEALSLGPLHGYGIIQRLRQLSDELLEVEQGSLYPAVYRTRAARLDQFQVGSDRDRPPGQVLHADESRK